MNQATLNLFELLKAIMKTTAIIFLLHFIFLDFNAYGQNQKQELITLMKEYGNNFGNPSYSHDFVDKKLNPALRQVENLTCEGKDYGLFSHFLRMLLKTKGSANELAADVLGGIFICKPEVVDKCISQIYPDEYLISLLELGFKNRTFNRETEVDNYDQLKMRLNRLKKVPGNNNK